MDLAKYIRTIHILGLQSISWDVADNVSHPRRLDPTMELVTYFFVLHLQHGRHDVKCKSYIYIYTTEIAIKFIVWNTFPHYLSH